MVWCYLWTTKVNVPVTLAYENKAFIVKIHNGFLFSENFNLQIKRSISFLVVNFKFQDLYMVILKD